MVISISVSHWSTTLVTGKQKWSSKERDREGRDSSRTSGFAGECRPDRPLTM